jgi:EAL domain-containing protein (putative c-di-GMP-specific phosphodiesterase class I)/ActR/RegA family two-component response regulator
MTDVEEKGRILLADDDAAVARSLSRILIKEGYHVDTASNGTVAAEILKGARYDSVISDITMPGMSGLDLLRTVREHDLDLSVLLITGQPDTKTAIRAIEHGALRYLVKPIAPDALVNEVAFAVKMCRMARVKREALELLGDVNKFVGDRAGLESRFQRALAGLWMANQPIVCWSRKLTHAHEVLVRSSEPSMTTPDVLFDAAERLGKLRELGRAIRTLVAKSAVGGTSRLFVNLHTQDLTDDELYSSHTLFASLADRVTLEITERASLSNVKDVRERIEALRRLGFRIAIDDLGAGYAGLTSFTQLQPDVVKLDMSLVRGADQDKTKQRVIGSMTSLCVDLGMLVVAEGVETPGERDALLSLGCDHFQGYLFAKPARELPVVAW